MLLTPIIFLGLSSLASAFCGASEPSEAGLAIHRSFQARSAGLSTRADETRTLQVYVHVIRESEEDSTLDNEIQEQLAVLNRIFSSTSFSFELVGTDTPILEGLGPISPEGETDARIKQFRRGGIQDLNLYIVREITDSLSGYATFPWDYTNSPQRDGIVMARPCIPGGIAEGYNTGSAAAHEVGHWLGLLHTFQDGCYGGDYVDDTPAEAQPAHDCPTVRYPPYHWSGSSLDFLLGLFFRGLDN
ncbi:hypothetical protein BJX63DRAFT_429918 [Aspergillus granulosus]|uniref:Peptidase M43 pregnancy-associated plasma-A domain-containing protein n=1 Tax=Aspergillus granulosus TaxID=176169 RepID=A0ABR4HNY7_9EURO